jgi:hypothetical protein
MSTNADRADRPHRAVIVPGEFADLLPRLFGLEDGHLRFGPARSRDPAETQDALSNWCMFDDYMMEGFVRYSLRARPHPRGLLLEIQLADTRLDRFVEPFVRTYIGWAGLSCCDADIADEPGL